MTQARKTKVSLDATPYYHCVGRCVRRAFLWGVDSVSGQDFSHRKVWVMERLTELSKVFAIDICAYAVMSNHYHLVLHIDAERAKSWSESEVGERWSALFSLPILVQKYLAGERGDTPESRVAQEVLADFRERLCSLSWYMRSLNEPLARRANVEDGCTGRFWEGRFKSQAILDEAGLLACCAYVDLNPVRAGIVALPELAAFTSIQQRLQAHRQQLSQNFSSTGAVSAAPLGPSRKVKRQSGKALTEAQSATSNAIPNALPTLHPFASASNADTRQGMPYAWRDYVELIDWAARIVRPDHKANMAQDAPPILARLGFDAESFVKLMQTQAMGQGTAIGQLDRRRAYAAHIRQRCVMGVRMPNACPA